MEREREKEGEWEVRGEFCKIDSQNSIHFDKLGGCEWGFFGGQDRTWQAWQINL